VFDSHLGSGSNRIAADKAGNIDFTGCEIDKDYYEAQEKRFREYKSQLVMQF
jgi:site-specific DNA-methyltransferase (adenine-specific)